MQLLLKQIIYTQLYGFKYSHLMQIIICFQVIISIYQHSFLHTVIWFQVFPSNANHFWTDLFDIDGTLKGTTTPDQSGPENNANEEVTPRSPELEPQH